MNPFSRKGERNQFYHSLFPFCLKKKKPPPPLATRKLKRTSLTLRSFRVKLQYQHPSPNSTPPFQTSHIYRFLLSFGIRTPPPPPPNYLRYPQGTIQPPWQLSNSIQSTSSPFPEAKPCSPLREKFLYVDGRYVMRRRLGSVSRGVECFEGILENPMGMEAGRLIYPVGGSDRGV